MSVVAAEAEAEVEVEVEFEAVDDKVKETMNLNVVHNITESIYRENLQKIGRATRTSEFMDAVKEEAEAEMDVVINHITCNSNSISIYLILLLQDKELYYLLRWLQ